MPSYDYNIAKEHLTETEKERLLCLFLTCDTKAVNSIIDWDKATTALGNASVASLRVMVRGTLKKVADKGGLIDDDGSSSTPKASSATPKKRKVAKQVEGSSDEEPGYHTPTKKVRARKAKFQLVVAGPDPADDEHTVKEEEVAEKGVVAKKEEADDFE